MTYFIKVGMFNEDYENMLEAAEKALELLQRSDIPGFTWGEYAESRKYHNIVLVQKWDGNTAVPMADVMQWEQNSPFIQPVPLEQAIAQVERLIEAQKQKEVMGALSRVEYWVEEISGYADIARIVAETEGSEADQIRAQAIYDCARKAIDILEKLQGNES